MAITIQITTTAAGTKEEFDKVSSGATRMGESVTKASQQMAQQSAQASATATASFQRIAQAAVALTAAFSAGKIFGGFIQETALLAARSEVLTTVLSQVAKNAGMSGESARQSAASVKALGITTAEANQAVTRFIQNQLDLTKVTQLARAAQNGAVIAFQNSSDALNGLIHGIVTLQPEVLRTYGIIVNLEQAYDKFARQTNTTANALTGQQKQQIALNEVLRTSLTTAGVYAASMLDVGKQIASLDRLVEEAQIAFGKTFLPVLRSTVPVLGQMLQGFSDLNPVLQSAIASIVSVGVAFTGVALAIGGLSAAFAGLGIAAFLTSPVGLAIIALAGLAAVILTVKAARDREMETHRQALKDLTNEQQVMRALAGDAQTLASVIEKLSANTQRTAEQNAALALAIATVEKRFPGFKVQVDTSTMSLNAHADALLKNVNAVKSFQPGALDKFVAGLGFKMPSVPTTPGGPIPGQQGLNIPPEKILETISAVDKLESGLGETARTALKANEIFAALLDTTKKMGISLNTDVRGKLEQVTKLLAMIGTEPVVAMRQFNVKTLAQLEEVKRGLLEQQADLQNKLSGQTSQRISQETASAITAANTQVALTAARFQKEAALLGMAQQQRLQAYQVDYQASLAATNLNVKEREAVERAFAIRAIDLARVTSEEKLALERQRITAEAKAEDGKIAAEIARQNRLKSLGPEAAAEANVAIVALNAQRQANHAKTSAEIIKLDADAAKARAEEEKGYTGVVATERVKQTQTLEQRLAAEAQLLQTTLQGRETIISAEQSLVQAQVEGEVLTKQQGYEKLQALQMEQFDIRRRLLESQSADAIRIAEKEGRDITGIEERKNLELEALAIQQTVQQQQLLNKQTEAWRQFGEDVQRATSDLIFDFLRNGFSSIAKLWTNMLDYMLRLFADFAAMIVRPLVMNVVANVVGGASSLLGGAASAAGAAGSVATAADLGKQLIQILGLQNIGTYLQSGMSSVLNVFANSIETADQLLTAGVNAFVNGTDLMTEATNLAVAEMADFAVPGVSGAGAGVSALGVAGGLAGIGGGIYGALNASNEASMAAYAASAAASAAYVGGILATAAGATAATTGWTGFGLIAAAVLGVIGLILDQVISPAGPSLAIGDPTGLNIGAEGGQLQVQGDLTTEVHKQEGVDPGVASSVQAQMEAGITAAVMSIVNTINAVALDPAALLGPTQDALQTALANIQDLNSGSAKNMEQDITEQLKFINVAIIGSLLGPVNLAFEQLLHTDDVTTQIERLPGTVAGLVTIFKTMNDQLAEIAKSQNTDVLRQLSEVKNQVEDFGAKIGGTAAQIAEVIVNDAVTNLLAIVPELIDQPLAEQITGFATVMNESQQALVSLQATQGILESAGLQSGGVADQITRLTEQMVITAAEVSTAIVSNALEGLSADLAQVTAQAVGVQATTVDSLFTDSLAALNTLWMEWHRLEDLGLDASGVEDEFEALMTGVLNSMNVLLSQAFTTETFAEFLDIAASIPAAVTAMNPAWQELQQLAMIFGTVVGPINDAILELEASMRSSEEQYAFTTANVDELRGAIVDAGTAIDQLLPLYAEMATAIQLQADAYEQVLQDAYQYAFDLIDFAKEQEAIIADLNAQVEALEKQLVSDLEAAIADQTRLIDSLKQQQAAIATSLETIVSEQDQLISNLTSQQEEIIQGYTQLNEQLMSDLVQLKAQVMSLQESIGATLREEAIPTQSADMIRAELAQLEALAATQTGAEQLDTLAQQEALLNELIALGKSTDQLVLIQEGTEGLTALDAQLQAMHGSIDAQYAAALTEQQAAQALGQQQVALLQAQIDEAQATKVAAQAQLDWIIIQTGQQAQSNAEIIAGAQANYNALQVQINEAVYVRSVLEEQLAWVKAVLGIVETVPLTILSTAAATIGALEHQIAIAQYYLELAQHEILLMTGTLDYEAAQLSLEAQMEADLAYLNEVELAQLEALNAELALLYATQPAVANLLHLNAAQGGVMIDIESANLNMATDSRNWLMAIHGRLGALDTLVAQNWQTGGFVHAATGGYASLNHAMTAPLGYAAGGMVPVMLEPQERVLFPSFSSAQKGALVAVNDAFPRFAGGGFTVPGSGTGDTFPALVPDGSFVLNRNASRQLGFQDGGMVQTGSTQSSSTSETGPIVNHINFDLRGAHFKSPADAKEIMRIFDEHMRKRGNTRL